MGQLIAEVAPTRLAFVANLDCLGVAAAGHQGPNPWESRRGKPPHPPEKSAHNGYEAPSEELEYSCFEATRTQKTGAGVTKMRKLSRALRHNGSQTCYNRRDSEQRAVQAYPHGKSRFRRQKVVRRPLPCRNGRLTCHLSAFILQTMGGGCNKLEGIGRLELLRVACPMPAADRRASEDKQRLQAARNRSGRGRRRIDGHDRASGGEPFVLRRTILI